MTVHNPKCQIMALVQAWPLPETQAVAFGRFAAIYNATVRARLPNYKAPLALSAANQFCMALVYGRAGRLTTKNGDFRQGTKQLTIDRTGPTAEGGDLKWLHKCLFEPPCGASVL